MESWQSPYRGAIVDSSWQRMSIMTPWNIAQLQQHWVRLGESLRADLR